MVFEEVGIKLKKQLNNKIVPAMSLTTLSAISSLSQIQTLPFQHR